MSLDISKHVEDNFDGLAALAEKHGLDKSMLKEAATGVIERVNLAEMEGSEVTPLLVQQAIQHWFISREKMYNQYMTDENYRMNINDRVIEELKNDANC